MAVDSEIIRTLWKYPKFKMRYQNILCRNNITTIDDFLKLNPETCDLRGAGKKTWDLILETQIELARDLKKNIPERVKKNDNDEAIQEILKQCEQYIGYKEIAIRCKKLIDSYLNYYKRVRATAQIKDDIEKIRTVEHIIMGLETMQNLYKEIED